MNKIASFLIKYKGSILLFLLLAIIPVVFNIYMLWTTVGASTFQELINGDFYCWVGWECNPFPGIVRALSLFSVILSLISQLVIIFAVKLFNTKIHVVACILIIIVIIAINSLFIRWVSSIIMSNIWIGAIYNTNFFFHYSTLADSKSWIMVLPVSVLILLFTVYVRLREIDYLKKEI